MPENVFMGQLHLSKACWELWLSDDQPHSDYNGQWQRALCMLAVLQSPNPNPQRNEQRKMYAIKQIKICAEYRDMLPRPRLDLSGTPGLRPIGLCLGSWQTSLGLGSMSRYSAQILVCITQWKLWLLMLWQDKESGHWQLWYWCSSWKILQTHQKHKLFTTATLNLKHLILYEIPCNICGYWLSMMF